MTEPALPAVVRARIEYRPRPRIDACRSQQRIIALRRHLFKQIDEVNLSFPGDFRGAGDYADAVGIDPGALFDLKPARFDASLSRHILLAAGAVQIAVIPEVLEEAVLADVVAGRLFDQLRHFADQDGGFGDSDGFGKYHFGAVNLLPVLQLANSRPFRLERVQRLDHAVGIVQLVVQHRFRHVSAMLADRRENLLKYQLLERHGFRQRRTANQPHHIRFGKNAGFLLAAEAVDDGVAFHHPTAMLLHGVNGVGIAECLTDILADEPRFIVDVDYTDVIVLKIEDLNFTHTAFLLLIKKACPGLRSIWQEMWPFGPPDKLKSKIPCLLASHTI